MASVEFFVEGTPRPQGSKRGFVRGGRVVLVENSKYHKEWRKTVAEAAKEAMNPKSGAYNIPRLTGPLTMALQFFFARPKAHFRTGKFSDELKASAPVYHTQTPDLDKLIRSVDDSLTGIVFEDDSLVVSLTSSKQWRDGPGQKPGVLVYVSEVL
tara:strand:- start:7397 stop:7861 length:465 start_codon:yes stop_codon:yes gene_type:complete